MKALRIFLAAFSISLIAGPLAPGIVRAQDDTTQPSDDTAPADDNGGDQPSFDYFYNALQDYGQWVQVEGYGYCWQPDIALKDPNWQPYTDGYWVYTDAGWTWVSYEDFGWIVYHYGRWAQVDGLGWIWVPDYQWAGAWVSWRTTRDLADADPNDAYVGWAPLPPEVHFVADIGISIWVDSNYDIGPGCYNFCRVRDFGTPVVGPVIIDRSRNITIINQTTNITNITTNNSIVYNGGPAYGFLSKHSAHPVPTLQLVRQTNPALFGQNGPKGMHALAKGNQLFIPAPIIAPPKNGAVFKPLKVAKTIDKPLFNKGWKGVDPRQKLQVQNVIKEQTKGIKPNQPAVPVKPQQLFVVPKGNNSPTPPVGPIGPIGPIGPKGSPGKTPFPGRSPFPGHSPFGKPTSAPGFSPAAATPGGSPAPTGRPRPKFTPPNGNPGNPNGNPQGTPLPKFTPPPKPSETPIKFATPPPKFTPPPKPIATPNQALINEQRKLEEEKAAAAAAAEHRQPTPPPAPARPTPPPNFQLHTPPPQNVPPGLPGANVHSGGKPGLTPTPTPH